ncbi:MAG: hypothetical protein EZS28_023813 [Streblomastix strix]|uniref:Uncharacterized protein n=1 Tax=Streblomastix strix TaxID=222440 RepID=A0A5J4VDM6_9EUKA|nr:MAG: hypothetical protein EZS28_023813 [Streblomastix strix]
MPIHVEQQEFSAMCMFKDMYDKSSAVQITVSGQLNMLDCEFQGTYILDNYTNSTNTNESAPEDVESHIDEVILKHEKQIGSNERTQEVGRIPDSVIPADGKSLGFPVAVYKPQESIPIDSADFYKHCASGIIFSKIKQLVQKVGKGLQCANDNVYKPFIKPFAKPILGALGPVGQTIGKGLDVASSFLDYSYGADKNGQFRQDFETLRNDEYLRQKLPIDIQSRRIQLQNP